MNTWLKVYYCGTAFVHKSDMCNMLTYMYMYIYIHCTCIPCSYVHVGYSITTTTRRPFLSWQTWDLLRVMYHGFRGFCSEYLQKHPGYTIHPIRFNGSAVETFFSQLKFTTSGHLSGTNYATARSSVLTRGSVKGKRKNRLSQSTTLHMTTQSTEKRQK